MAKIKMAGMLLSFDRSDTDARATNLTSGRARVWLRAGRIEGVLWGWAKA